MNLKDVIPAEFYKADLESPFVETAGELIEALQKLPPELPIKHGFDDGCRLVVFNIKEGAFLEVVDSDD